MTTQQEFDELYPEHAKQGKIVKEAHAIGEFLDWLSSEKNMGLGYWDEDEKFQPDFGRNVTKLLAEFFEIDLAKIEQEKRAMLDAMRAANARQDAERDEAKARGL